jgi:hypothetical protein
MTWGECTQAQKGTTIASSYISPYPSSSIAPLGALYRYLPHLYINYKRYVVSRILHMAWWSNCTQQRNTRFIFSSIADEIALSDTGIWYRTNYKRYDVNRYYTWHGENVPRSVTLASSYLSLAHISYLTAGSCHDLV